ncbi:hypothetical protein C8F01DRAFT_340571 [Mycena amicta]|nr:hypothetical protein C8F01DRAFT_340571 [Mycena amicta]
MSKVTTDEKVSNFEQRHVVRNPKEKKNLKRSRTSIEQKVALSTLRRYFLPDRIGLDCAWFVLSVLMVVTILSPAGARHSTCGYCSSLPVGHTPPGERSAEKTFAQKCGAEAHQMGCDAYKRMMDMNWRRSGLYDPEFNIHSMESVQEHGSVTLPVDNDSKLEPNTRGFSSRPRP